MRKPLFICGVLLIFLIPASGQDMSGTDSLPKAAIIAQYTQTLQQQQRLYNGITHTGYSTRVKGTAYFVRDWQKGSLVYEGIEYKDIPVLYDLYKDQVIIQHYNDLYIIGLISSKVQSFTLPGHRFERIQPDSVSRNMPEGFYEVLYDGGMKVFAKRSKKLREYINVTVEYEFTDHQQYFIRKDGAYHAIRSEGKLMELLGDQRSIVRQHLRKNGLKFNRAPEETIVKAVEYYESLKK